MTEEEWKRHAEAMYLPSLRKQRLFLCAICRRILHLVQDENCHRAIEIAEGCADGRTSPEDQQASINNVRAATLSAMEAVAEAARKSGKEPSHYLLESRLSGKPNSLIATFCATVVCELPLWQRGDASAIKNLIVLSLANSEEAMLFASSREDVAEPLAQESILRDIKCPPSTSLDPSWLKWKNGEVKTLSQSIYDDRAFDQMPELAAVLEEAGCTDTEILSHCRGPGPHVLGCWVVDLILGKE